MVAEREPVVAALVVQPVLARHVREDADAEARLLECADPADHRRVRLGPRVDVGGDDAREQLLPVAASRDERPVVGRAQLAEVVAVAVLEPGAGEDLGVDLAESVQPRERLGRRLEREHAAVVEDHAADH